MASLWRWHAAEENEHKAVAFDVYQAAGGSYSVRVVTMFITTVIFLAYVVLQQIRMMWVDGCLFSLREWQQLGRFMFVDPGTMRGILPLYFVYYRRSFHPWDHDNQALLDRWKEELQDVTNVSKRLRPTRREAPGNSGVLSDAEA
jgi:predicted metal-dependent hydrolase